MEIPSATWDVGQYPVASPASTPEDIVLSLVMFCQLPVDILNNVSVSLYTYVELTEL